MITRPNDPSVPARAGEVGQVAATFRLRNLRENLINPSDDKKRRLKPAATIIYNIKSLNLGNSF